jgi:hypothetical protein
MYTTKPRKFNNTKLYSGGRQIAFLFFHAAIISYFRGYFFLFYSRIWLRTPENSTESECQENIDFKTMIGYKKASTK